MTGARLLRFFYRELARRPLQALAAVVGIALGLAVVVSVQVASQSVARGFSLSNEALSGRATHQLVGIAGSFDEAHYVALTRAGVLQRAAPMVSGSASADALRFDIVGIDPFVDSGVRGASVVTDSTLSMLSSPHFPAALHRDRATALGIDIGDKLEVRVNGQSRLLHLAGLLPDDAVMRSWLVTDIAIAQDLLGKRGLLDRVDIVADDEKTLEALRRALPPSVKLVTSQSRSAAQIQMTRALNINLTALSLLALVIGMFLVFNAMNFSVLRRFREIGLLRALGVTRGEIFGLVLAEAVVVGVVASVFGVVLGLLLAHALLDVLTRTVNDLYFRVEVTRVEIDSGRLVVIGLLGVMASVLATLAPAYIATRAQPRATLLRSSLERGSATAIRRAAWLGLATLVVGFLVLSQSGANLVAAFVALFFVIAGFALMVPLLMQPLTRLLGRISGRGGGVIGALAIGNIDRGRSRTGVALAALVVAVAATSGVGMMIDNFRMSVTDWLESFLTADVYVAAGEDLGRDLPIDFIDSVSRLPGVAAVDRGRWRRLRDGDGEIQVFAIDTSASRFSRYRILKGDTNDLFRRFEDGALLVSEALAFKRNLAPGDELELAVADGTKRFTVAAVYRDYGSDSGLVVISGRAYRGAWADSAHSSLGLYLEADADDTAVGDRIEALSGAASDVRVYTNRSLRAESLVVFDRTFALTRILRLLAVIVAVFGIVSALAAIQTERLRQSALLSALGMTRREITALSLIEAAAMGLIAGVLALPLGIATAWLLSTAVNRRAFGWTIDFHVNATVAVEGVLIAVVAALVAGSLAAWLLNSSDRSAGLRHE